MATDPFIGKVFVMLASEIVENGERSMLRPFDDEDEDFDDEIDEDLDFEDDEDDEDEDDDFEDLEEDDDLFDEDEEEF